MKSVDIKDIDFGEKNYGFHFTSQENENSFDEKGLEARIGVNSSGKLGKEANPKVFFSNGVRGALMTFNRTTNIPSSRGSIAMLVKDYYRYLPDRIKAFVPEKKRNLSFLEEEDIINLLKSLDEAKIFSLDYCETFEFMENFMRDNMYLIFEAEPSRYEHELTQEDIEEINESRDSEVLAQIDVLDEKIDICEDETEIQRLTNERNALSRKIRKQCIEVASQKRGEKLFDGFFDIEDYNEEHCEFLIQPPNNTHSAVMENNVGKAVSSKQLRKLSSDSRVDAVTLISKMLEQRDVTQEYAMRGKKNDVRLIEFFVEYLKLPRNLSQEARNDISKKIAEHTKMVGELFKQRPGFTGVLPEEQTGIEGVLTEMRRYRQIPLISTDIAKAFSENSDVKLESECASEAMDKLSSLREESKKQIQEEQK